MDKVLFFLFIGFMTTYFSNVNSIIFNDYILLYIVQGFAALINWTAVLFQGFVNFVIPAALYLTALRTHGRPLFAKSGAAVSAGGDDMDGVVDMNGIYT